MSDTTLVFDLGSQLFKAGYAGYDEPSSVFHTAVSKSNDGKTFVGNEALGKSSDSINYPLKTGYPQNDLDWDSIEKLYAHAFKELKVEGGENKKVLLSDTPLTRIENREKLLKMMFEKFKVESLYFETTSSLSLYSVGKTSGVVVDLGHSISHIVPIYSGYTLVNNIKEYGITGEVLNQQLKELLKSNEVVKELKDDQIYSKIKEKFCYVAVDFDNELSKNESEVKKSYKLPDGKVIKLGFERLLCPEVLFQPSLLKVSLKKKEKGIHAEIFKIIKECGKDEVPKKSLYKNILISGGSSQFRDAGKRLNVEMKNLVSKDWKSSIKVSAPKLRKYSTWIGGSLLTSLDGFSSNWITRKEYEEQGTKILNTKCSV